MSQPASGSSMRSFAPAAILIGGFVLLLVLLMPEPVAQPLGFPTATLPVEVAAVPTELPPTEAPAVPTEVVASIDPALVSQGENIFATTCSACHGLNARGIPGLGKDLVDSQFVHGLTDDALLQFIVTGRDTSDPLNTTGIPMPPRGGNPSLTDDQLHAVIAYLRSESASISAQAAPAEAPAVVQVAPTATPAAPLAPPVLPTSIPVTPPTFTAQSAFIWSCAGCHGADGTGNEPFASGFMESDLLTDRAALLAFLVAAHPPVNPLVEFPHPPMGGYPQLTDEQLEALTDYVISLRAP